MESGLWLFFCSGSILSQVVRKPWTARAPPRIVRIVVNDRCNPSLLSIYVSAIDIGISAGKNLSEKKMLKSKG